MQYRASLEFLKHKAKKRYKAKPKDPENNQIDLLFEHIPRKIISFEAYRSITWNHLFRFLFRGFLPKQVRALPAIIVISGCIMADKAAAFAFWPKMKGENLKTTAKLCRISSRISWSRKRKRIGIYFVRETRQTFSKTDTGLLQNLKSCWLTTVK